jgi:hypothetical protein
VRVFYINTRVLKLYKLHKNTVAVYEIRFPKWVLFASKVELGYNVTKGTGYFFLLQTSVVVTEDYNVKVSREELIGCTEYLAQCCYNRGCLYSVSRVMFLIIQTLSFCSFKNSLCFF